MTLQTKHKVRITGADKTQAAALAIEFWTSKGYTVHSDSYNCIIFRRNGYGTFGKILGDTLNHLFVDGSELPWDQHPVELTVLCQVHPKETIWDVTFKLGTGYIETTPGDFSRVSKSWCNEFSEFCREWMNNATD